MEAGASGFLVKDAPAERLANAIRRAAAGERIVDPELAAATLQDGESALTPREREVLEAGADGSPVSEIARRLQSLGGHRTQLPLDGDRQDRRPQPYRGMANRARPRLALTDTDNDVHRSR